MIRPGLFFTVVVLLLGMCVLLSSPTPAVDVFGGLKEGQALALDELAVEDIAALKLRHIVEQPSYRFLILGNSRSLPITSADLGIISHSGFNLSLTGESLRSSVLLMEWLAQNDRLPKVALISFDNAELNYYSNPYWAPPSARWRQMVRDLKAGLRRPSISLQDVGRMAIRHAMTEATLWSRAFNASRIWRGLTSLFWNGGVVRIVSRQVGYQSDGSRSPCEPKAPYSGGPLPTPNRNVLPGYLDYDLERLARIADGGTRIIIYETPLFPSLQLERLGSPSAVAAETRTAFLDLCAKHGLECHPSPPVFEDFGLAWPDAGHPPAAPLAAWIKSFLQPDLESASR